MDKKEIEEQMQTAITFACATLGDAEVLKLLKDRILDIESLAEWNKKHPPEK